MSETLQTRERKAQPPREDEWFEVKPRTIDLKLFIEEREDWDQEETRQLILKAFSELNNNPEKYGRNFKTMMPKKDWVGPKTGEEFRKLSCSLGDCNANWVQQAFEWAQRIANGESWRAICNDEDTANFYRYVVWNDGDLRLVGGSRLINPYYSPAKVRKIALADANDLNFAVPLVVSYEVA